MTDLLKLTDLIEPTEPGDFPHPLEKKIKDALYACQSIEEVNTTARHFAREVSLMELKGGYFKITAIHIKNLAKYRRDQLPMVLRKK